MTVLEPPYHAPMRPVYPCRAMPTRHCPALYEGQCIPNECARYNVKTEDDAAMMFVWMCEIE